MIAAEIDGTLIECKNATAEIMSEYNTVVFGSRIHAGMIDGLKKAKEMFRKSTAKEFIIFVTGGTPNAAEEVIKKLWNRNLTDEELQNVPCFYMQSGLCYERMSLPDKVLMKMASAMMKKKKDKNSYEKGFEQAITSSYDISSKAYIEPLVSFLKEK